jgi:hypothetical protein
MAWTQSTGTQSATVNTEHTLASPTTAGTYVLEVDTVNLVLGDLLELRVYNKIDGTNYRQTWKGTYQHVQTNNNKASPPLAVASAGAKFTLKQTAGTGRSFPWALNVI